MHRKVVASPGSLVSIVRRSYRTFSGCRHRRGALRSPAMDGRDILVGVGATNVLVAVFSDYPLGFVIGGVLILIGIFRPS